MTPLAIRNVENYTIILSENQICSASVDENGEMGWACSMPVIMNISEQVSINNIGSLVTITIHDNELFKKACMASVIFENKDEIREPVNNNSSSIIIVDQNQTNINNGWYSIKIYDKNESILFNETRGYTTIKYSPEITLFEIPGEIRETLSIGYYYYYPPYSPKKDLVFQIGEPVEIMLSSEELRKGYFPRIADEITFVISDTNGTTVWNQSVNPTGEGSHSEKSIITGSGSTGAKSGLGVSWNQTDINNNLIKPGTYKAGIIFKNISYNVPADYSRVITLRISERITGEGNLTYQISAVPKNFDIYDLKGIPIQGKSTYYAIEVGGKKYAALNGKSNEIAEILIEDTEKKSLVKGQTMDMGNGYSLYAQWVDSGASPNISRRNSTRLTFYKDKRILKSQTLSSGDLFEYSTNISNETNIPIFSIYVDAIFEGLETDVVFLRYTWLMSEDVMYIKTGDVIGKYEVVNATANMLVLKILT
ncbi:MAG: hypothetical protein FIB07_14315 [Candidatus Methanoperedens sp.]|nr:hypothetical protein [Candidatus Methanoperedens sp.]